MASRIIQIGPPKPLECNLDLSKLADMLLQRFFEWKGGIK
jgi:hypothetical protein